MLGSCHKDELRTLTYLTWSLLHMTKVSLTFQRTVLSPLQLRNVYKVEESPELGWGLSG